MNITKPADSLKPYVKFYWGIENNSCAADYDIRIVPTGLIEVDFYLGTKPEIIQSDKYLTDNIVVVGQQQQYYDIHVHEKLLMFSVVFQPAGAMMFFDVPIKEFYNENVPLRYFLKAPVNELEELLFKANSFDERVALMDNFLMNLLEKNNKDLEYSRVISSVGLINKHCGNLTIDNLASNACLSRKQFERVFSKNVGSTPKQYLRTVRFQFAIHIKNLFPHLSLTELAYKSGYFDQSHMITDFKLLTGMTPGSYFSNCDLVSDYFN